MDPISIIIPNYNGEKTINKTISSLEHQTFSDFDVIIIDDASKDNSVSVIRDLIKNKDNYKLIELKKNKGASNARNMGVANSKGKIILFTDSDVILKEDTVQKIIDSFKKYKDAAAIVGFPDKKSSFKNLASEYFNLRIYHNFMKLPEQIDILYTTICAVKRNAFHDVNGFNTKMKSEEDPELGFRLSKAGYKIILNRDLTVLHYKYISFLGLLKNDFKRSVSRVKLLLREKMTGGLLKKKRFISTPNTQIYSAFMVPFILLSLFISFVTPFFLIVATILLISLVKLNYDYLVFISKEKGKIISAVFFLTIFIDMIIIDFGLFIGIIKYFFGETY